ncbi:hypothetical protein UNH65_21475 [Chitinophaga sp. 180180018-2]
MLFRKIAEYYYSYTSKHTYFRLSYKWFPYICRIYKRSIASSLKPGFSAMNIFSQMQQLKRPGKKRAGRNIVKFYCFNSSVIN